jgi:long-subunit fatty acid transport protein
MLETEYGEDAWTRYDTVRNRIETTNVQATAAMQVTERWTSGSAWTLSTRTPP